MFGDLAGNPTGKPLFRYTPPMESATSHIRPATAQDITTILQLRRHMYQDMGQTDPAALDRMMSLTHDYLTKAIPAKTFRAWLGEVQNEIVTGGAVVISPWPAHTYDLDCRRATILNVYTCPQHRRQGHARKILETMIAWCKSEGFARVDLHASDDGRPLYESLGFEPGNEMRLKLR